MVRIVVPSVPVTGTFEKGRTLRPCAATALRRGAQRNSVRHGHAGAPLCADSCYDSASRCPTVRSACWASRSCSTIHGDADMAAARKEHATVLSSAARSVNSRWANSAAPAMADISTIGTAPGAARCCSSVKIHTSFPSAATRHCAGDDRHTYAGASSRTVRCGGSATPSPNPEPNIGTSSCAARAAEPVAAPGCRGIC